MKIRATVAAILVVIGIGIVCVCRQTQTRKPSAGVPSAPAVATQDAAAVAPRAATVTSPAATALTLSATNQTPRYSQPGEPFEEGWLSLELKRLADVGL